MPGSDRDETQEKGAAVVGGKAGSILATIPSTIPITVHGDKHTFESYVDNLNAAQWLDILLSDGTAWHSILAISMPDEDVLLLSDMLISRKISQREVSDSAKSLLSSISGRSWWEVFNILALAEESWEYIGGDMATGGVDPSRVTLGSWIDAAWTLIRRLALQKGQQELDQLVNDVRRKPESETDDSDGEMEASAFLAAAGELAGVLPGLR